MWCIERGDEKGGKITQTGLKGGVKGSLQRAELKNGARLDFFCERPEGRLTKLTQELRNVKRRICHEKDIRIRDRSALDLGPDALSLFLNHDEPLPVGRGGGHDDAEERPDDEEERYDDETGPADDGQRQNDERRHDG